MVTSINLYRSYWEAISLLPDEDTKARLALAIVRYAFDGVAPDESESAIIRAMFAVTKPNLDKSRSRAEAGAKGGSRGIGEAKIRKQNASKTQATYKGEGEREGEGDDSLTLTQANANTTAPVDANGIPVSEHSLAVGVSPCTLEQALKEVNRKTLQVYPPELVEEWFALRTDNHWRQAGGKGTLVGKSYWRIDLFKFWNKRENDKRNGVVVSQGKAKVPVSFRGTSDEERSKLNAVL